MTNREWLESLNDVEFAIIISEKMCKHCSYGIDGACDRNAVCKNGIAIWLAQKHKYED